MPLCFCDFIVSIISRAQKLLCEGADFYLKGYYLLFELLHRNLMAPPPCLSIKTKILTRFTISDPIQITGK